MMYRAYWKTTWYKCKDYGALCRCLAQVGANSFYGTNSNVDSTFMELLLFSGSSVYVRKVDCDEED